MIRAIGINTKERKDRLLHIRTEFDESNEFNFSAMSFEKSENGAKGLWININEIILNAVHRNDEYIILCEDDHQFTERYTIGLLQECIFEARQKDADVLLGGVSWFKSALQVTDNLFWVDEFSGLQFTVIFSKFYKSILNAEFNRGDASDYKISSLTNKKFIIHPFISVQKDFGYSDVTFKNNNISKVGSMFNSSAEILDQLRQVNYYYQSNQSSRVDKIDNDYEGISIPVHVINTSKSRKDNESLNKQFIDRSEYDINLINDPILGHVELWECIVNIIKIAIENDDEFIVICDDKHMFTSNYSLDIFLRDIVHAHLDGADILFGGVGNFGQVVPIKDSRYWINPISSFQFFVVFGKFYDKILSHSFKRGDTVPEILSMLTSHKMIVFPFISKLDKNLCKKKFHYTMADGEKISSTYNETSKRMENIQETLTLFQINKLNV